MLRVVRWALPAPTGSGKLVISDESLNVNNNPRLRLGILGIAIVSLFAALFARLWYLQVMATKEFKSAAAALQTRTILEEAPRGRILDRNGVVLVDNRISVDRHRRREEARRHQEARRRRVRRPARPARHRDHAVHARVNRSTARSSSTG